MEGYLCLFQLHRCIFFHLSVIVLKARRTLTEREIESVSMGPEWELKKITPGGKEKIAKKSRNRADKSCFFFVHLHTPHLNYLSQRTTWML